jgi:hypothetical protein
VERTPIPSNRNALCPQSFIPDPIDAPARSRGRRISYHENDRLSRDLLIDNFPCVQLQRNKSGTSPIYSAEDDFNQTGDTNMFKTTNIAVAVAIALTTTSGAFAATKNHRNAPAPVTTSALNANASAVVTPGVIKPTGAMLIQDRGYSASVSDPYCGGRC